MCGIAGFYGFKDSDLIKTISKQLEHRGPDGEGYFEDEQVTLLSRRLAIIDVAGGDQPIYNEDQSVVVVYNGEIYNFESLRKQLQKKGHGFTTKSDTEVIVHGYEEWGDKVFDKLNGMFTVALYDKNHNRFILARDHFGIKPLYYSLLNEETPRLIFSSEITPIFKSGLIKKQPNERILYRYLRYRIHDDQEETFFQDINRLMPGQLIVIENRRVEKRLFTRLREDLLHISKPHIRKSPLKKTQDFAEELTPTHIIQFKKYLTEALRLRLISEVPVGSALSGGLDSSTIVAVINKLLASHVKESVSIGKIQKTFSAVFPGSINDEEKYVDALVEKLHNNIDSHKIHPTGEEFFHKDLEEFIRTQEEPTISTGPYAQYKVMQEAHKHVTVLLDGQGSDEMMAGYLPYFFVYLKQLYKAKQYDKLFNEVIGSLDVLVKYFLLKIKTMLHIKEVPEISKILSRNFRETYQNEKFETESNNLKNRLVEDIFSNSLQALLRYEDRNSMHFSVEGRVPFLDFNLIRYLFTLPDEAIIKNGWNKYILRQATTDILPKIIVKRRNKIGFTTPEHEWFMRMKNRIYSIFTSESFKQRPYFNQTQVLKAFRQFVGGRNDDTMFFWRILNAELWLQSFFDEKKEELSIPLRKEFGPNEGKKIEIQVEEGTYLRIPVRTEIFEKGDNFARNIAKSIDQFLQHLRDNLTFNDVKEKKWYVAVSEKIVAIAQGRSYFLWEIETGFWANFLSKYVKRTPYGIGLGSPWTMQIAIREAGLPRILAASFVSLITKPLGLEGVFYRIAGEDIAAIDGPTEYSVFPSNVSAKLAPKDPQKAAKSIRTMLSKQLPKDSLKYFAGVAIIDANDLGQKVLGNTTDLSDEQVVQIFSDNPLGQTDEQTPLALVFKK